MENLELAQGAEAVNNAENAQAANNAVVKVKVIDGKSAQNVAIVYNGEECKTEPEKVQALRTHFRESVLRKYGISTRNEDGTPVKNELVINGRAVRPKLPAIAVDADGAATETLKEYYERTSKKCAAAYKTLFVGLERIDFVPEMN